MGGKLCHCTIFLPQVLISQKTEKCLIQKWPKGGKEKGEKRKRAGSGSIFCLDRDLFPPSVCAVFSCTSRDYPYLNTPRIGGSLWAAITRKPFSHLNPVVKKTLLGSVYNHPIDYQARNKSRFCFIPKFT